MLGIGVIGTVSVANMHLAGLRKLPGVRLAGVADIDIGRARSAVAGAPDARWTSSVAELALQSSRAGFDQRQRIAAAKHDDAFGACFTTDHAVDDSAVEPGDVIETGTPSGVGATTGTYVTAGDVMEARIDTLGTLRTPVSAPTP